MYKTNIVPAMTVCYFSYDHNLNLQIFFGFMSLQPWALTQQQVLPAKHKELYKQ